MKRIALIALLLCGVLAGSAWHGAARQIPDSPSGDNPGGCLCAGGSWEYSHTEYFSGVFRGRCTADVYRCDNSVSCCHTRRIVTCERESTKYFCECC